ncbi:outer membrane protein assembly factor BamB family protein [Jejuia pallidilutea]|nr:PQQ-binding-like beta-propeller repeat protein [Jejuia pallidilutea]
MGSRGNKGISKHVVFINRKTGQVDRRIDAGHVDYRAGYAPLVANEKYVVYPYTVHDIEERPPLCSPFTRIIAKDTKTGSRLWDFNIGPHFSEPYLEGDVVYVANQKGDVYCLDIPGKFGPASAQRINWEFKADGAVNRKVEVDDRHVYFGSNNGTVYCLDKKQESWYGNSTWKTLNQTHSGNLRPCVEKWKIVYRFGSQKIIVFGHPIRNVGL